MNSLSATQASQGFSQHHIPTFRTELDKIPSAAGRIACLEAYQPANQDERTEIYYLILKEKCFNNYQSDLNDEKARLLAQPYSVFTVAYKELGSLCHDYFHLSQGEELDADQMGQLLKCLNIAEQRFYNRSTDSAYLRYLQETAHLKTWIEARLSCPLVHLVRRGVNLTLTELGQRASQVNAIFLTINFEPNEKGQLAPSHFGCSLQEGSYSSLEEKCVELWYTLFGDQPPTHNKLTLVVEMQSLEDSWNVSFKASVA